MIINPLEFIIINILGFDSVLDEIKKNSFKLCNLKIATIIIIIPFFEELIFRLSLKPKIQYLFISFFLIFFLIFGGKLNLDLKFFENYRWSIFLAASITFIVVFTLKKTILNFIIQNNKLLICTSIFLFGLVHILNIANLNFKILLFYPFFVIPQMIMGYFITNLRIKYNFFWGYMLHVLINTTFILSIK